MEELKTLIDFIQGIGFVGILIVLAIPKTRRLLGFDGGSGITPEQLREALTDNSTDHPALVARIPLICTEQIKIRVQIDKMAEDISGVREDISYLRGKADNN